MQIRLRTVAGDKSFQIITVEILIVLTQTRHIRGGRTNMAEVMARKYDLLPKFDPSAVL
jgi:hypothetical protein